MVTSMAKTLRAPFCSRQSVNPPVELPTSMQTRSSGRSGKSSSAPSSFSPARLAYRSVSPAISTSESLATCAPALSALTPLTRTWPPSSNAWARCREGASPRWTINTSRRSFGDLFFFRGGSLLEGCRDIVAEGSRTPYDQKLTDLPQPPAALTVDIELAQCLGFKFSGNRARFLYSIERRISGLLLRLIFSRSLAEGRRRFLYIQQIVNHLKRPANMLAESLQTRDVALVGSSR